LSRGTDIAESVYKHRLNYYHRCERKIHRNICTCREEKSKYYSRCSRKLAILLLCKDLI